MAGYVFSFVSVICLALNSGTILVFSQQLDANNTDLAGCSCDLTVNACDINCCCDLECDSSDRMTFSTCLDQYTPPDSRACLRNDIIIRNNTPYRTEVTDDGLFCIYKDNYNERNYYINPDVINSSIVFDDYKAMYATYGYQQATLSNVFPLNATNSYYVVGDEIFTVYESGSVGLLGLPAPLTTAQCLDTNPAAYLTDQNFECTRTLTSLASDCMTNLALSAAIYYQGLKVITTPVAFNDFPIYINDSVTTTSAPVSPTPPGLDELGPLYNSSYVVPIEPTTEHVCITIDGLNTSCSFPGDLPSPSYDIATGVCSNAVVKVLYTINYNGTEGIQNVTVQFTFREVTETLLPLTQGFQTEFQSGAVGMAISGNPGYVVGKPVLAGNIVTYQDAIGAARVAVEVSTDPLAGLTIVTSAANGLCANLTNATVSTRVAVNFGESLRSGCFINVSYPAISSSCDLIQEVAVAALTGPNPPTVVATFGNSSTEITGDWVEILTDSPPSSLPSGDDTCLDIVTGQHWEIMYSNTGDVNNPQAKIIGVSYKFITQNIRFQCYGQYCQPGSESATQMIEVASSVEFIDATEPAVATTAARPQISARLPADFFYPFA